MADGLTQVLPGLWRAVAVHPDWTEDEGGEDGWEPEVAWHAVASDDGLVLIDPIVTGWVELDALVAAQGGCAGIIRTCHWHQRSVADAAIRYAVPVWARPASTSGIDKPFDRELVDGQELFGLRVTDIERIDEIGLWWAAGRALFFGDAMIRSTEGTLHMCPPSWTQPSDGRGRLREILTGLVELPVEHVLVSHGPLVLGDGAAALTAAVAED